MVLLYCCTVYHSAIVQPVQYATVALSTVLTVVLMHFVTVGLWHCGEGFRIGKGWLLCCGVRLQVLALPEHHAQGFEVQQLVLDHNNVVKIADLGWPGQRPRIMWT